MSEEDTAKWEGMKSTLSKWPSMSLDEEGTFKYVLIEAAAFMEVQQLRIHQSCIPWKDSENVGKMFA